MGCRCGETRSGDHDRELAFSLLEQFDLRGVAEQAVAISGVRHSASRHDDKAERAEHLGFGEGSAKPYHEAAARDRAQAARQYRACLARLDERTQRHDWHELVQRVDEELAAHNGHAILGEASGRLRLALFERDGLAGEAAGAALDRFDACIEAVRAGGLHGAVSLLRDRLVEGLETVSSTSTARIAEPPSQHELACIGAFTAVIGLSLVACMFVPLCWCCYGIVLIQALIALIAYCFESIND